MINSQSFQHSSSMHSLHFLLPAELAQFIIAMLDLLRPVCVGDGCCQIGHVHIKGHQLWLIERIGRPVGTNYGQ